MMIAHFKDLFAYNLDANTKLIPLLVQYDAPAKALQLFSHVLNAQQVWNNRILPQQTPFGVWQEQPATDFSAINTRNHEHTLQILDTVHLETVLAYQNSQGASFQNKVHEILFQVINHSTYHRAQIASIMKQSGITPVATDYILYKR